MVAGRQLSAITADFGAFWQQLACESQLRWLGPEKGVIHLALAAVINALWDLPEYRSSAKALMTLSVVRSTVGEGRAETGV